MEKKQRIFRITDQEHDALKAFLDKIRNKKAEDKDSEAQEFLDKALVWFNSMKGLVAVGTIDNIPNPFKSQPVPKPKQMFVDAADTTPGFGVSVNDFLANIKRPQNQMPQPATVEDEAEEPMVCQWLDNILNGDYFPPVEENTRSQNEFLQNKRFQNLYKIYRKTRAPEVLAAIVKLSEEHGINE